MGMPVTGKALLRGAQYAAERPQLVHTSPTQLRTHLGQRGMQSSLLRSTLMRDQHQDALPLTTPSYRYARLWHALHTHEALAIPEPRTIFGIGLGATDLTRPVPLTDALRATIETEFTRTHNHTGLSKLEHMSNGDPVRLSHLDPFRQVSWQQLGVTPATDIVVPELAELGLLFATETPAHIRYIDLDARAVEVAQQQVMNSSYWAHVLDNVQAALPEQIKVVTRGDITTRDRMRDTFDKAFDWLATAMAPHREHRFTPPVRTRQGLVEPAGPKNPYAHPVDQYRFALHPESAIHAAVGDAVLDPIPRAWASLTLCLNCFDYIGVESETLQREIALARIAGTVVHGGLLVMTSLNENHVEALQAYGFSLTHVIDYVRPDPGSRLRNSATNHDIGIWRRTAESAQLTTDLERIDGALV
jgi:hypothetical protein